MPEASRSRPRRRGAQETLGAGPGRGRFSVSSLLGVLVGLALLGEGVFLRSSDLKLQNPTPDEYFYTIYAVTVHDHGFTHVPEMAKLYLRDSTLWVYPAPTRVGYLWLSAAMMHLTSDVRHRSVQLLSVIASLLALLLLWGLATQRLGPWPAAIALAFMTFSPLDLAMARRAWQDSVLGCLTLAALFAWSKSLERPERRAWLVAFLAIAGYAVLVKETALIVLGLGTLGLGFWHARRAGTARGAIPALAGGAVTLAAVVVVLALACGGFAQARALFARGFAQSAADEYMRRYQQGSAAYYPIGLGALEPVPFALGSIAALLAVLRAPVLLRPWSDRTTRDLLTSLGWFVLLFAAIATLSPQKNMRFLSPMLGPICLLAAALLWAALVEAKRRLPGTGFRVVVAAGALVLAWSCLADFRHFQHFFLARQIPDLATPYFVGEQGGARSGSAPEAPRLRAPAPDSAIRPGADSSERR